MVLILGSFHLKCTGQLDEWAATSMWMFVTDHLCICSGMTIPHLHLCAGHPQLLSQCCASSAQHHLQFIPVPPPTPSFFLWTPVLQPSVPSTFTKPKH